VTRLSPQIDIPPLANCLSNLEGDSCYPRAKSDPGHGAQSSRILIHCGFIGFRLPRRGKFPFQLKQSTSQNVPGYVGVTVVFCAAYRWICGGVSVNYHALNDFRADNEALMDNLLTDNVAALAAAGAISLTRVAQDGMRVRADAGAASFRRQASLEEHLQEASELVQTLKAQAQSDPAWPVGAHRRHSCALPRRVKRASRPHSNNCPKWPQPRSATDPRPKPDPAPPMPMRVS